MADRILFQGNTHSLTIEVKQGKQAAIVAIAPSTTAGQMPEWDKHAEDQAAALLQSLKGEFGEKQVVQKHNFTNRELTVAPAQGTDAGKLAEAVAKHAEAFAQGHQILLDTDERQPDEVAADAAKTGNMRASIKQILQNQMLDTDQKTDALMVLFLQQQQQNRGGGRTDFN